MIDPLAIADDIERRAAAYGTDFPVMLTQRGAHFLAAALRLAETMEDPWIPLSSPTWSCSVCGATCKWNGLAEFRGKHKPTCAWAAYRAAKEKA